MQLPSDSFPLPLYPVSVESRCSEQTLELLSADSIAKLSDICDTVRRKLITNPAGYESRVRNTVFSVLLSEGCFMGTFWPPKHSAQLRLTGFLIKSEDLRTVWYLYRTDLPCIAAGTVLSKPESFSADRVHSAAGKALAKLNPAFQEMIRMVQTQLEHEPVPRAFFMTTMTGLHFAVQFGSAEKNDGLQQQSSDSIQMPPETVAAYSRICSTRHPHYAKISLFCRPVRSYPAMLKGWLRDTSSLTDAQRKTALTLYEAELSQFQGEFAWGLYDLNFPGGQIRLLDPVTVKMLNAGYFDYSYLADAVQYALGRSSPVERAVMLAETEESDRQKKKPRDPDDSDSTEPKKFFFQRRKNQQPKE